MNPNFVYQDQLVTALADLDGIHDRATRDRYIQELERELRRPLAVRRSDRLKDDLWELVGACLHHAGALHKLVIIVETFHGAADAVVRLRSLVEYAEPHPVLDDGDQHHLDNLLAGVEPGDVADASRPVLATMGPQVRPDPGDLRAVVQALTDTITAPGEPPRLLTFLVRLADTLQDPVASELREWTETVAERLRVPADMLERIRTQPAPPLWSYLVVQLREDLLDPDRYLLSVWLHTDGGDWELHRQDNAPRSLPDIRRQLDAVLGELAHNSSVQFGELTVEFILPRRLLGHDVDRWLFTSDGVAGPLGIHFPLTVRSLERMRNGMVRPRWQKRCEWLHRHGGQPLSEAVSWKRLASAEKQAALLADLLDNQETPVCLVLSVPEEPGQEIDSAVAAGLQAGIPIIVWCRSHRVAGRFDAAMTQLLAGRGVAELPALVLQLRRDAVRLGEPEDHPGLHVTLLWDCANRLPPMEQLRAPERYPLISPYADSPYAERSTEP